MIAADHLCRPEAADGCRAGAGGQRCCASVSYGKGWDAAVAGMQVWPCAQLPIVGLHCQDNKFSRAPARIVPVPGWQGAGLGRQPCRG
jgi:hypothetical protein